MKKGVIVILIIIFLGFSMFKVSGYQLTLTEIGELHTGSRTVGVYVNGNILYALDLDRGLKIYNISDPATPEELGSYRDFYSFSHAFCYTNDLILIADYEDKLEIVNVSNPSDPELIGHYREVDSSVEHFGSTNLHNTGNIVFLASQYEGVEIIDIKDPVNPIKLANYYFGKSINVVYAENNLAFIREMGGGFKILEITNITDPLELYHCSDVRTGQNFCVMNNLLYIPDSNFGLRIYNISDPVNAFKVGEKGIDGTCMKCIVDDRGTGIFAYVSAEEEGLIILDVSDPEHIEEIGRYNDGGQSFSLFIQNNLVFVAEFSAGLEILQLNVEETTQSGLSLGYNACFIISGLFIILFLKRKMKL
ncbi:MAG: LVIVD repeat-containing protein [Candidatus Hodarchaeota archaeon]